MVHVAISRFRPGANAGCWIRGAKFEEGSGDCLGPPARFRAGPDGGSAPRKSPAILGLQIVHFRVKFTFPAGTIAAV